MIQLPIKCAICSAPRIYPPNFMEETGQTYFSCGKVMQWNNSPNPDPVPKKAQRKVRKIGAPPSRKFRNNHSS